MKTTTIDSLFINTIRWMINNKFVSLIYDEEDQEVTLISHTSEPFGRSEFIPDSDVYKKFVELELICRKRIRKSFKIEL